MTLFSNEYQGGISFEVFTPQGSNPLANWKITGPGSKGTKKVYEKEVKGYVFSCPGGHGFKMQFPKDERKSMCLLQPFLCYQMHITEGQQFALELSVTTEDKTRRRLFLSTAFQELKATALHAQVPLRNLRREGWTNLVFNAAALVENCFPNHSLRSIDLFILSGCFKLRRVFTLKQQPPDTVSSHAMAEVMEHVTVPVPVTLDFPVGVGRETQVLDGLTLFGKMQPLPNEKKAGTPVLSAVRQHPDGMMDGAAGPQLGIQGEAKKVSRERTRGPASPQPRRRSARRILDSGGAGATGTPPGGLHPEPQSSAAAQQLHQAPPSGGSARLHANGMSQRSSSGNSRAAAEKAAQQQQQHPDDGRRAVSAAVQRQAQANGPSSSKGDVFPASSSSIEKIEEAAATGRKALSAIGSSTSSSVSSSGFRNRAPSSRMSAAPPRVNIDPFDMSSSLQLPHSPPPLSPTKHQRQLGPGNAPAGVPRSPSQHRFNPLKGRDLPQVNGASSTDPALSKWANDGVTVSCSTSLMKLTHSSRYGDSGEGVELQQVSSSKRFWGDPSSVQPEDVPLHRQLDLENVLHSRSISGRERVPPLSQQSQQHSQQTMLLAPGGASSSQLSSSSSRDHLGGGGRPHQHPSGAPAAPTQPPNAASNTAALTAAPPSSSSSAAPAVSLTPVAAGSARNARRNLTYASTDDASSSPAAPTAATSSSSAAPVTSAAPMGGGASVGSPSPSVSTSGMPPIVSPVPLPEAMQSTSPRGSMARNPRSVTSLASFGQPGADIPGTAPLAAFSGNGISRNRVELESIERGGQHVQALSQQQPLGSSSNLEEASTRIADEVLDEVLRSSGSSAAEVQEEDEAVRASTAFAGPPEEEDEEGHQHHQQETEHASSSRQQMASEEPPTTRSSAVNEATDAGLPQDTAGPQQQQLGAGTGASRAPPESQQPSANNDKPVEEFRNFLSRKVSADLAGIEAQIAAARNEAGDTSTDLWHSDASLDTSPRQRAPDARKARTETWPEMSDDTYSMLNMMNTQRAFTPPVVPASKVSETSNRTLKLEGTDLGGPPESELNSTQDSSIDYRDLIYDPILNCYYDSKSNQYFSLT